MLGFWDKVVPLCLQVPLRPWLGCLTGNSVKSVSLVCVCVHVPHAGRGPGKPVQRVWHLPASLPRAPLLWALASSPASCPGPWACLQLLIKCTVPGPDGPRLSLSSFPGLRTRHRKPAFEKVNSFSNSRSVSFTVQGLLPSSPHSPSTGEAEERTTTAMCQGVCGQDSSVGWGLDWSLKVHSSF